jgi:peptidoglycan/xylan/chitin deacetylase (PgdA/CDA1 family)/nucleoid-associated protein YgaU
MGIARFFRVLPLVLLAAAVGCSRATAPAPRPMPVAEQPTQPTAPAPERAPAPPSAPRPPETPLPEVLETPDFIVVARRDGETPADIAGRHLGDPGKAWMITDYASGQEQADTPYVIVPRHPWNPVGVYPWGYQLVPVLAYPSIARERNGRSVMAAKTFEEHMRYLKAEGFRTVTLREFVEFIDGRRQLPMKSILLTFDGGHNGFLRHARPLLNELGFHATLFVATDAVGAGPSALSWNELTALLEDGFDVQASSKTGADLRRRAGESGPQYDGRMDLELGVPVIRFRQYFARTSETVAYPSGAADDDLFKQVRKHGYVAGFTLRRESNPAFVSPTTVGRVPIQADATTSDVARSLKVFRPDTLGALVPEAEPPRPSEMSAAAAGALTPRRRMVALHSARADELERKKYLRQALVERTIAAAFDPQDEEPRAAVTRLQARITDSTSRLEAEAKRVLDQKIPGAARLHFLAILALDPTNRGAFEALREKAPDAPFITHTVKSGDTLKGLAELYYGSPLRAEAIAATNGLSVDAALAAGRTLRIPELPGIPLLPR